MALHPRPLLLFLAGASAVLAGATLAAGQSQRRLTRLSEAERAQCAARHGRVMIAGLSGNEMCALPYPDAGRRCTRGAQCAGDCLYEHPAGAPPLRENQRVAGRCEAFAYGFGCRATVENGRIAFAVCTD